MRRFKPCVLGLIALLPLTARGDLILYYPLDDPDNTASATNQGSAGATVGTYAGGAATTGVVDAQRGLIGDFAPNGAGLNTNIDGDTGGFHNQSYTASAWVNLNGTFGGGSRRIVFGQDGGNRLHAGTDNGTNLIQGHWGSDGFAPIPATMLNDEWTHLTFVYDQPTGFSRIYANGQPIGTTTINPINNTANVVIGAYDGGTNWQGLLDEVGNFEKTFNDAEVLAMFQLSLRPEQEPSFSGQAAYLGYTLDEIDQLIELHDSGMGEIDLGDGNLWQFISGLNMATPGLSELDGQLTLLLDPINGTGLQVAVVPEPASVTLWFLMGLVFAGVACCRFWRKA